MSMLKETLAKKIEEHRPRTVRLLKEHGDVKLSEVTIAQAIGGARGVRCLVTDTSYLDPMEGIRFRGMTIPETRKALPKPPGAEEPYALGLWWLLLTGQVPTEAEVKDLEAEVLAKSVLPDYVTDVLRAMPEDSHPMAMFVTAIAALERESVFRKRYDEGMAKTDSAHQTDTS